MRIISKFNDYYDSVAGRGIDPKLIYHRNTEEIEFTNDSAFVHPRLDEPNTPGYETEILYIGFCGKAYPCISHKKFGYKTHYSYVFEQYQRFLDLIKHNYKQNKRYKKLWKGISIKEFLSQKPEEVVDIFYEHKAPVFVIKAKERDRWGFSYGKPRNLILNPRLEDYEFYRLIDPYTAFQEISMYISGVLGIDAPKTVEISDKSKIEKRGFDKWSFRKESINK